MDPTPGRLSLPRLLAVVSFGFAITLLVNTLEPALLGHRVLELAPARPNTAMGLITFAGLLLATAVQPIVGFYSDRSRSRWGRRLPFFVVGAVLVLVALYVVASAPQLGVLLAGVLLLQLGSNTVQAPWQALIPDLVPPTQRGQVAGLKALLDILALVAGRQAAGQFISHAPEWGQTAVLATAATPGVAFVVALAIAACALRDRAPSAPKPTVSLRHALAGAFQVDLRRYPAFAWWFAQRFLFWGAFILLNTFLLFYLIAVLRMDQGEAQRFLARLFTVLGAALAFVSLPTGWLADRIGCRPLIVVSSVVAGAGTIVLLLARSVPMLTLAGAIIGVGIGVFMTASWALVTDIVPPAQAARYLGLANMAAAGGSAVARLLGGATIDALNRLWPATGAGYRVVFGVAAAFFWASALVALRLPGAKDTRPSAAESRLA